MGHTFQTYETWLRDKGLQCPRYAPIHDDGSRHEIDARSIMIERLNGERPKRQKHPKPPQSVVLVHQDAFTQLAMDAEGWVYALSAYPWGWLEAGHVSDYVVMAFQALWAHKT